MTKRQKAISMALNGCDQRTKMALVEKKKTAIQTQISPFFDCLTGDGSARGSSLRAGLVFIVQTESYLCIDIENCVM